MNDDPRLLSCLLIAIAAGVAAAAPASAQEAVQATPATPTDTRPEIAPRQARIRFVLPFEVAQGMLFDDEREGLGWLGSIRALPGLAVDDLQLNALVQGLYRNPEGDFLIGARISHVLFPLAQGTVGIRAAAEGGYMVRAKNAGGSLGLIGDLGGILQLGGWFGRDFAQKSFYALISVGTDVMTWGDPIGAIIASGPMEDSGDGR